MAINVPIYAQFNDKGLKDAENAFEKFGGKVAGIAKAAAAAVAGIAAAAGAGAVKAIGLASDLAETQAKVGEIFDDQAAKIESWAAGAATALGQSQQEALDAASTFAIFGKAAGLAGNDLVAFSTNLTGLASDLASFNNTSPEEAVLAIGAALRGEAEPLRRFGVLLDDATLKQKALELGIYDGNGALTQQQKILAAEVAIFEQTSTAQGDFARTSDGLANKQRILRAQLQNVFTTMGTKLLPVALKLAQFFGDKVLPVIESVSKAFGRDGLAGVLDLVKNKLPAVRDRLLEWGGAFVNWIRQAAPKMLAALGELLVATGRWLRNTGLPALAEKLREWGKALIDWIGPRIGPALTALGEFIAKVAQWFVDDGLPMIVAKLQEWGGALVDWIKPRIAPMLAALGELLAKILLWIVTDALPKISAQAVKLVGAMLGWIAELLPQAVVGLAKFVGALIAKLPGLFAGLFEWLAGLGLQLGSSLVNAIVDGLKSIGAKSLDVGKAFVNGIIDFINTYVIRKINDLLEFTIDPPGPGSFKFNPPDLPEIPRLALGGVVTSPTLALIGESGPEAVVPLSKANRHGGMGSTINITVTSADPNEVVRALRQYISVNGSLPLGVR